VIVQYINSASAALLYFPESIPVDFIFVEVANLQMELGYATFSYPEPVLHAVNEGQGVRERAPKRERLGPSLENGLHRNRRSKF
jgi:hypothetical protein